MDGAISQLAAWLGLDTIKKKVLLAMAINTFNIPPPICQLNVSQFSHCLKYCSTLLGCPSNALHRFH